MRDLRGGPVRTALGYLVIGALVLTGCSEKQEASTTLPTIEAAPTTEALPALGPEDMPMPDEARTKDADGAEAFVRYYVNLINRTSTTLDAEPLRQFSDGCDDCDRIASNAEMSAGEGYRYEGGRITVTEVAPPLVTDETAEMAIRVDQAALTVIDASGTRVEDGSSDPFSAIPANVALEWDADSTSWRTTYLAFG